MSNILKIAVFLIIGSLIGSVAWGSLLPGYGPAYTIYNIPTGTTQTATTVYINTYSYPSLTQSPAIFFGYIQSSLTGSKYQVSCMTQSATYNPGVTTPEIDAPTTTGVTPIHTQYQSTNQQNVNIDYCSVSLPPGYGPGQFNYSASGTAGSSGNYTLSLTQINNGDSPIIITIPLQLASGSTTTTPTTVPTTIPTTSTQTTVTSTIPPIVNGTTTIYSVTPPPVHTTTIAPTTTIVPICTGSVCLPTTGGYLNTGTALGGVIGLILSLSGDSKRRKK